MLGTNLHHRLLFRSPCCTARTQWMLRETTKESNAPDRAAEVASAIAEEGIRYVRLPRRPHPLLSQIPGRNDHDN